MVGRKFLVIVGLLFFVLAPSWASNASATSEDNGPRVVVKELVSDGKGGNEAHILTDPAKPIMVRPASPGFTVRMVANPTTGYQWYLADYNPRFIKVIGQQYVPDQPKLAGSPGLSIWQFQLQQVTFIAPQVTHITFEYRRPWELKALKRQFFTVASEPSAKTG